MKKDLLIFPYNGNGIEAIECINNDFNLIGFIDDTIEKQRQTQYGFQVYSRTVLDKYKNAFILAVPGSPKSYLNRKRIIDSLQIPDNRFATVIHPKAAISSLSKIGKNVLIMPGVILTSNCKIANHVCILPNTVIHHDSSVGEYTLIGSNVTIAGNITIENNCYIGSGTSIINDVTIGSETLIGIGSNVIKSLPNNSKAVGNPAKLI